MLINLKVKTLDAQTHEFSIDNEITVREFKDNIAERTNIAADQQRIIYCGRVLVDEKQLKEYDVDGKVVHVAERPPPSQRGPSTSNAVSNDNGGNVRERPPRGMRNSPLFRALDGMVVGTMAIPVNAGSMNNAQVPGNPFTQSSSFCMNRITVARHMLNCANNIANYLEDPERGLNNTSLDILQRGRWTMESTVVEVGITAADLPQNQNIVEMVQGAVSAALRRNGNTNVTVVQLPTVFGSNEVGSGTGEAADGAQSSDTMESIASTSDGGAPTATVIIEDVIDADDDDDDIEEEEEEDGATNASSSAAQAGSATSNSSASNGGVTASNTVAVDGANNSSTSTGTNTDENSSRRRTGTTVLAEVVEQMRTVQTRLNPFIQQFYDMLLNEPSFEESDTAGRENAQRLFDRVSEAFHYMSHAQHAISDLMLDVSQPAPRYLACRPILVEQSGYVSSNNYLSTAAAAAAAASLRQLPQQLTSARRVNINGDTNAAADTNSPPTISDATDSSSDAGATANPTTPTVAETTRSADTDANGAVEDPVDDPIVVPIIPTAGTAAAHVGTQSNDNHQLQMERLIQAVVQAAPIETEFHVEINAPSIVSFGVPMNPETAQAAAAALAANIRRRQQNASATTVNGNGNASNGGENSNNGGDNGNEESNATSPSANAADGGNNQARVNTATLPTTATQTRSTSRPQLQIGNMPHAGWNGRFIPANMMSSFDRFLPCNSHHIREPENGQTNGGNGTAATNGAAAIANNQISPNDHIMRNLSQMIQGGGHSRAPLIVGSTMNPPRSNGANSVPSNLFSLRNLLSNMTTSSSAATTGERRPTPRTAPSAPSAPANPDIYPRNLRAQLLNFVTVQLFAGAPINAETMPPAINRAVNWFNESLLYLPQYEKPQYDARDSVCNLLRRTLPLLVALINDDDETPVQFETRIREIFAKFKSQLFSLLSVLVGRVHAEMYWRQLMRLLLVPVRLNFRDEALQFLVGHINFDVPLILDLADAQQFVSHRSTTTQKTQEKPTEIEDTDTDVEMTEAAASTSDSNHQLAANEAETETATEQTEPLPNVVAGSEPWHRNFPNDWLPIITRDIQTQAESQSQAPFSDAYISGMSAKRRKLIQSSKPSTDVRSMVADSVRKAIQTVGVSTSTASNQSQSPEEVISAIANDNAVQVSYTEAVRTNLRERLKKDPDYKSDKYPQTTKFLNNK